MTIVDDILMFFCVSFFLCRRYHRGHNVACLAKGRAVFDLSPVARAAGAVAQVAPLDGTRVIHSITSSARARSVTWHGETKHPRSFRTNERAAETLLVFLDVLDKMS